MFKMRNIIAGLSFIGLGVMAAGCAVGPNFQQPEAPGIVSYTSADSQKDAVSSPVEEPHFILGQDIPAQWWTLFRSEGLDRVVRMALADSPTLSAAQAALRAAQENVRVEVGTTIYPTVDAKFSADRQKFSLATIGQSDTKPNIFNLYRASVGISYLLDIFGSGRRGVESLRAKVDYQNFQLEGAYLALTANIVTAVVQEVALREQILALREMLAIEEKQLQIIEQQLSLGGASRLDVLNQKTQVEQTRANLPGLEKELAFTRHQLTALLGKFPSEEASLPVFHLKDLTLPPELPVSIPSQLVRQRPDIRAAEAMVHEACAMIGIASANLYPQITLTANYGPEANRISDLFDSNNLVGNIGAGILQPIFNAGKLRARRRAAVALYDQAVAQYRQAVLLSFQNVADVLRALESDAGMLKTRMDAAAVSGESLELAQKQYSAGALSHLSLLNAQRQYQQARIGVIQAQAMRFADTAALFQALGGGWWNRDATSVTPDSKKN